MRGRSRVVVEVRPGGCGDTVSAVAHSRAARLAELEQLRRRAHALEVELGCSEESEVRALTAREQLLTEAERVTHVGSFAYHLASGTLRWSDELFRIFGLDPEREAPLDQAAFDAAIHPDDRERVRAAQVPASLGQPPTIGFRVRRPDGSLRHVQMQATAEFDASGAPVRLFGTVQDVTDRLVEEHERRRQEAVLRSTEAQANAGSWRWRPSTNEAEWSAQLRKILALSDGAPSFARLVERIHPDDRARVQAVKARLVSGGPGETVEFRVVHPDGSVRYVVSTSWSLTVGGLREVVGTMLDVSDVRGLESALFQARKLEALGRLAGGVAHDFNNLLAVMHLAADELSECVRHAAFDDLRTAIDRGAALTRQLLAFGRKTVLEPQVIEVAGYLRQCVAMSARLLGDAVRIEIVGDIERTGRALVDPAQLQHALLNLLVNARDAMPRGGTIRVAAARRSIETSPPGVRPPLVPGEYVELIVRDEGEGLGEEVRAHLFEPFFTTKPGGTGLGLATMFGTISQSGGGIEVQSCASRGTAFHLFVPGSAAGPSDGSRGAPQRPAIGRGERVLVLDDRVELQQLMARALYAAGFDPVSVPDPAEVVRDPSRWTGKIDALVTDVSMGGPHGPDIARMLWERTPGLPVLFVSGHLVPELPPSGAAPAAFLAKPFTSAELVDALAQLLARVPA